MKDGFEGIRCLGCTLEASDKHPGGFFAFTCPSIIKLAICGSSFFLLQKVFHARSCNNHPDQKDSDPCEERLNYTNEWNKASVSPWWVIFPSFYAGLICEGGFQKREGVKILSKLVLSSCTLCTPTRHLWHCKFKTENFYLIFSLIPQMKWCLKPLILMQNHSKNRFDCNIIDFCAA